jgi:hypothetical protein
LSSVAVCVVNWLLLVQQTVVPTGTVTSFGVNEKSAIVTTVSPPGQVPVGLAEA